MNGIINYYISPDESRDFSTFPKYANEKNKKYFTNLNVDDIEQTAFDNVSTLYYSKKQLLDTAHRCGYNVKYIEQLKKYYVVYRIETDFGKRYVGVSQDFGERGKTHSKDSRSDNGYNNLHTDINNIGRGLIQFLEIFPNKRKASEFEDKYIAECIVDAIRDAYPSFEDINDLRMKDIADMASWLCYNRRFSRKYIEYFWYKTRNQRQRLVQEKLDLTLSCSL